MNLIKYQHNVSGRLNISQIIGEIEKAIKNINLKKRAPSKEIRKETLSSLLLLGWSDSIRIKEFALSQEVVNKAWSSYTGDLSKEVFIKDFNWINVWFNRGRVEIFELLLTILFFIIITFFTFSFNLTNILKTELYPFLYSR